MSSYQEAKDAGMDAFNLVASWGASVCTVRPIKSKDGWLIEVETARPVPNSIERNVSVKGVPIVLVDRGAPSIEESSAEYNAKLDFSK